MTPARGVLALARHLHWLLRHHVTATGAPRRPGMVHQIPPRPAQTKKSNPRRNP